MVNFKASLGGFIISTYLMLLAYPFLFVSATQIKTEKAVWLRETRWRCSRGCPQTCRRSQNILRSRSRFWSNLVLRWTACNHRYLTIHGIGNCDVINKEISSNQGDAGQKRSFDCRILFITLYLTILSSLFNKIFCAKDFLSTSLAYPDCSRPLFPFLFVSAEKRVWLP